jgi:PAS domain S-box-containing protein
VSESKKKKEDLEKELEEIRKRVSLFDDFLDYIPDLIYFKDKASRFVEVSRSKAEQVGLAKGEVIGKTDFDYFTEEHARPAYED